LTLTAETKYREKKMIGTTYTEKLPRDVRQGMDKITQNDCYLIKRRINGVTGNGLELDCHKNVQDLVDKIGGKRISGWLLVRQRQLVNQGVFLWIFHSIWQTPEGECVDVTKSDVYGDQPIATFWLDSERQADMELGAAYNSVVVFGSEKATALFSHNFSKNLDVGVPYWTENSVSHFCSLDEHDGIYRWLHGDYPNNRKLLEKRYNCRMQDNRLVPLDKSGKISAKIYFDFSVS
jgi:hypothetical protein